MYGEGFDWAGFAIIVLLGQQRNAALDFCYHFLRSREQDGNDAHVRGIHLKRMVD